MEQFVELELAWETELLGKSFNLTWDRTQAAAVGSLSCDAARVCVCARARVVRHQWQSRLTMTQGEFIVVG